MMMVDIQKMDVVALTRDHAERGLVSGQVGTVVEVLDRDVFEVEFCDDHGRAYATAPLKAAELMVLHYSPVGAT